MYKCRGRSKEHRESLAYWDARLKRMGLGMDAGRTIGAQPIEYLYMLGKDTEIAISDGLVYVHTTGESKDTESEWPVSLC